MRTKRLTALKERVSSMTFAFSAEAVANVTATYTVAATVDDDGDDYGADDDADDDDDDDDYGVVAAVDYAVGVTQL